MTPIFLDTVGLLAVWDEDDQWHAAAQSALPTRPPFSKHLPMRYRIEFGDEAIAELRAMPKELRRNIGFRLDPLQSDIAGDVKKLKRGDNEYRLRAGNHRALFA